MLKTIVALATIAAVATANYPLITICNDRDFKGNCVTWYGDIGSCYNVNEYNDAISSAKPDSNKKCWLFEDINCQGGQLYLPGPAYNLVEQNFNDKASSFRCYFN